MNLNVSYELWELTACSTLVGGWGSVTGEGVAGGHGTSPCRPLHPTVSLELLFQDQREEKLIRSVPISLILRNSSGRKHRVLRLLFL